MSKASAVPLVTGAFGSKGFGRSRPVKISDSNTGFLVRSYSDPGFGQVGCVCTAQGFEYDWSGVIIGPDLVWRTDRWVVDRSASKDPIFTKATPDSEIDRLIRNTYKVLLTRGMVGTIIYSTDPETRDKLCSLVHPASGVEAPALV